MGLPLNIDWQQILLHLFNFLILVGGLYLLLYKPVKNFMEKRKKYFSDMDEKAKAEKNAAELEKQKYLNKLKDAESEIEKMKIDSMQSAKKIADEYIEDAKHKKEKIISSAKTAAETEKEKIFRKANSEIEVLVSDAVDKMLVKEGTDPLDEFLDRAEKEDKT